MTSLANSPIIDSHQMQCNLGNASDTSKQPEISRFLQVTPILLSLNFVSLDRIIIMLLDVLMNGSHPGWSSGGTDCSRE